MKAAYLKGPKKMVVKDVDDPKPKTEEAIVKVRYCGICGSDLHAYDTGMYSGIMGHEFSGDIESIGPSVRGWKTGDRVTASLCIGCGSCYYCIRGENNLCTSLRLLGMTAPGAYAERIAVRSDQLHRLSDNTSYEVGATIEPVATPLRAVKHSVTKGDKVLVMGAGPIGLLAMQCARIAGASKVYVTQTSQFRADAARKLGADQVFNPNEVKVQQKMMELTNGLGTDVVLECVGKPETIRGAQTLTKKGGKIIIVGECHVDVPVNFANTVVREVETKGIFAYSRDDFEQAAALVETGRVNVAPLITDKIGLSEIVEKGFEALLGPAKNSIKVLVDPAE